MGLGGLEPFEHQVDHGDMNPDFAAVGAFLIVFAELVPRQLYLPVGVNQFCRFTSLAWPRCWAALVR